jgi:hypothetical protein
MTNDIRIAPGGPGNADAITGAHRGTQIMRLVSVALGDAGPLDRFIATRRVPGDNWRRWDDIADEMTSQLGSIISVSRESVRQWAMELGIPEATRKNDGAKERGEFLEVLSKRGIPYV